MIVREASDALRGRDQDRSDFTFETVCPRIPISVQEQANDASNIFKFAHDLLGWWRRLVILRVPCCPISLFGAAAGMGAAYYAKLYHADISAKPAAVDSILATEANAPLADARRCLARSSNKGPQHLKNLLDAVIENNATDTQRQEYGDITYLNHCELVAVASKAGVMDGEMYKQLNRSA